MLAPRRLLALTLLCLAALAPSAAADALPEPRLAFVEWLPRPPMTRLATVAADGSARRAVPLAGVQPMPFDGPEWSADGTILVFAGYRVDAAGRIRDNGRSRIYAVGAAGGVPREVAGTVAGSRPVLSPDGRTLAFARTRFFHRYDPRKPLDFGNFASTTTWVVGLEGGGARRLTPWRNGAFNAPADFSPDGAKLLLEREVLPGRGPEVLVRDLAGGPLRILARGAEQPAYSPDGSEVALIGYGDRPAAPNGPKPAGELYVLSAGGVRSRRLTRTPGAQESQPSWSPDGARIAYLRTRGSGGSLGFGTELRAIAPDGSCRRRLAGACGRDAPVLYGPAWRPGPGAAGPLSC